MPFPVSPTNNQIYNDGTYNYRYNSMFRSWTKIAQTVSNISSPSANVVTSNGNVTTGNVAVSPANITVGNTTVANNSVTVGNTTVNNANVTIGNTVVANNSVTVGNTTINNANITIGNTTVANNNVTVGTTVIGNTSISTPNISANITSGNTSIVPVANGNVAISVAGTSNVVVVSNTGANISGNVAVTSNISAANISTGNIAITGSGNITGDLNVTGNLTSGNANLGNLAKANFFQGDGSLLTNVSVAAGSYILNGTSNVYVDINSNVRTSVGGNANVFVVTGTGVNVAGTLNVTGNANVGNIGATTIVGNLSGNVTTSAQPSITSLGTLTGLTVSGTTNLGAVGNVTITGGTANYFLMTNGSGSLSWNNAAGVPAPGSNTQIFFNDNGNYAANSGFTFNKTTGNVNLPSNLVVSNNVTATTFTGVLTTNAQPNVTSVGTLVSLVLSGNINSSGNIILNAGFVNAAGNVTGGNLTTAGQVVATGNITGNYFIGNGSQLTGIDATAIQNGNANVRTFSNSNVTISASGNANIVVVTGTGVNVAGTLNVTSNANVGNLGATGVVATTLGGTLTTASQPNITGVGTLTSLGVNGTVTAVNFTANTGVFAGSGANLTTLNASNISSGTLAQARLANASLTVNGTSITLGGSGTITANTTQTLTFGSYLTGTSFNGGTANTIAVDATTTNTANKVVARDANGSFSANIITATLSGSATSAGSATTAGTVTANAQPNITSVGTLTTLSVNSNVTTQVLISNVATGTAPILVSSTTKVANLNADLLDGYDAASAATASTIVLRSADASIFANLFYGAGNNLSNIQGANVSGAVATATTAGTVTTNAQPNITSVGSLTSLTSSGNITGNNVITGKYLINSVQTGISAAGTTQGTATLLGNTINVVGTVISGANGVVLPNAIAGMTLYITNLSANALNVFPNTGAQINGGGANTAISHAGGATLHYIAASNTLWYTVGATYA